MTLEHCCLKRFLGLVLMVKRDILVEEVSIVKTYDSPKIGLGARGRKFKFCRPEQL